MEMTSPLTIQITQRTMQDLGRLLVEVDRPCSKVVTAAVMLGMPIIREHPELVDRLTGDQEA